MDELRDLRLVVADIRDSLHEANKLQRRLVKLTWFLTLVAMFACLVFLTEIGILITVIAGPPWLASF
jgi:hypothetical protein